MEKTFLGKTNLLVSSLGLGGASLGTKIYKDVAESVGVEIVKKAFELGINWVDVSPVSCILLSEFSNRKFYGITKAETTLGKALQNLETPREQYYIATKCGRYGDNEFDFSAERVTRSVNESLQRLQLDYVDLLQCHDIEFTDLDKIVSETLPALRRLKESGKIRYIGITGYPLKIFKYILERDEDEIVDTVLSYCHYSLNNTQLNDLIPFLEEKKVGIINAAPLSMGLLTSGGPPSWHPASPELKNAAKKAVEHCQLKQIPVEKLALQFSASNEHIHSTLIGSGSIEEVERNVKWFQELKSNGLDYSLVREVQSIFGEQMNKPWMSGKPENNF